MKLNSTIAVLCLATLASAQTTEVKGSIPSKNGPPSGSTGTVLAQPFVQTIGGSDECTTPDLIAGNGAFAVDTTLATTSVGGPATCVALGRDVWFLWTANGTCATIETCGGTTSDTVLVVYDGATCPPTTQVACVDDSCGLQSSVSLSTIPGNTYLIRVASYGTGAGWMGTLTISSPTPGIGDDDCSTPTALSGPGVYAFDNTAATTGCQGQGESLCLSFATTRIVADRWYTYTATTNGTATVSTCGLITSASKDTRIAAYAGAGCPSGSAIACNDDVGASCSQSTLESTITFPVSCGQTYTIQVGQYATGAGIIVGQFSLTEAGTACGPTFTTYCYGDGTGTACPCGNNGAAGNGCASSVNANGGNLTASGTASIAADTFTLLGSGMPNSSALYFQGTSQISVVFGDGLRCAGGSVIRLGTKANVAGASQYPAPGDQPIHIRGLDVAGDARTYQCWYRNAAAFCTPSTFNLTNGVAVTWVP